MHTSIKRKLSGLLQLFAKQSAIQFITPYIIKLHTATYILLLKTGNDVSRSEYEFFGRVQGMMFLGLSMNFSAG